MAAAVTPLQTLSRRAGNYAPKAAPSPALLGDLDAAGEGTRSRRSGSRAGTARGGRAASLGRQGQLPFEALGEMQVAGEQEVAGIQEVAGSQEVPGDEQVLARETVVIRRRTLVVEKAGARPGETASGLRAGDRPTLRRIVLADLDDQGTRDANAVDVSSPAASQRAGSLTCESVPAPKRDLPIVLEAVGTVAITALGMAALLFLG
jgi:hypothetical protein